VEGAVSKPSVLITFAAPAEMRAAFSEALDPIADVTYLADLGADERRRALASASVVMSWFIGGELHGPEEFALLRSVELVQLLSAGADRVPFDLLPAGVPLASNAGAYADAMAEHVLAMALTLAKRLPQHQAALARGEFEQAPSRALRGSVVGVLGFGGIGHASARLFRAFGARIHAVNRSGRTDADVEHVSTLADLDAVLVTADVVVISLPLSLETRGLIGRRELELMKPDAILVNVARAAIVDEDALYEHLRANPGFSAGIDVWWEEPPEHGTFKPRRPFLELKNVVGSPHNSGMVAGWLEHARA
jgi:glycerate dehydrogenase